MTRMKLPLIITLFSFIAVILTAMKPARSNELIVPFQAYCMPLERLQTLMTKYSEVPMINMSSTRIMSDGTAKHYGTTLFANAKESSWTLVEQVDEKTYCVVAAGMNLTPAKRKNDKDVSN